ncbi:MAG: PTS galactitol transporter subunit IIC [Atopobiaceae bacterium]|nr:PTS galactitol transporter subunit IIC [Atopobiaceae bacterium]MCH4120507.1 PTS galactitol transporter subunit IIC [Atopobiaceae bacterium]MCI1318729.1 PTS galactitol transporter subunit IIC [Atopobiaceae bacterium]MCI1388208.1 PTS galactitol transporter subunit IIC [Atopobiaceae bacterium]MCI1431542.1 PTS galactitol transporter subunit IIC [Atopobiaceae bacterium]
MEAFISVLNTIFSTFGAAVIVPVILFIIAKAMGVETKKAINSAMLCAVGLTGFSLVINSYSAIVAPVVSQMVDNAGVNLPVLDTGWQSVSVIAYSTRVGVLFIGVAIVLQLVLFFVKYTDVFMASDLWNNYSFMVWGSLIYAITGNMWLAMACMIMQLLYILLFSEAIAKRWQNHFQYPNCCMTAPHHLEAAPYAVLMNWLLGLIGFNKIKLNAETIQKKIGLLGEPMFIGLFVGLLIGIIGNFNQLGDLSAWGTITSCGVSTAAIMAVFPKVGGIFASAFTSLTDAYRSKAAASGEGREWYLSVNDAAGYGEPNTLVTGTLLMPIMLGLAFVLPGNLMLPMADLTALPYMSEVFVAVSHGNIAKSIVMGAIWFSLGMVMCSQLAPTFTQIAVEAGFELPQAGVYVMSFGIMCHPFMLTIFYAFLSQNPLIIGIVVIVYVVCYILFKKNRKAIVDFIENYGVETATA